MVAQDSIGPLAASTSQRTAKALTKDKRVPEAEVDFLDLVRKQFLSGLQEPHDQGGKAGDTEEEGRADIPVGPHLAGLQPPAPRLTGLQPVVTALTASQPASPASADGALPTAVHAVPPEVVIADRPEQDQPRKVIPELPPATDDRSRTAASTAARAIDPASAADDPAKSILADPAPLEMTESSATAPASPAKNSPAKPMAIMAPDRSPPPTSAAIPASPAGTGVAIAALGHAKPGLPPMAAQSVGKAAARAGESASPSTESPSAPGPDVQSRPAEAAGMRRMGSLLPTAPGGNVPFSFETGTGVAGHGDGPPSFAQTTSEPPHQPVGIGSEADFTLETQVADISVRQDPALGLDVLLRAGEDAALDWLTDRAPQLEAQLAAIGAEVDGIRVESRSAAMASPGGTGGGSGNPADGSGGRTQRPAPDGGQHPAPPDAASVVPTTGAGKVDRYA